MAVDPDEPYWLVPDDLLIQRSNTLDYVGTAAVFDGPASTYIYPDLMMRVRSSPLLPVTYLWRALSAQGARNHMRERATGTAGNMPKVNSQTVRSIPVPVAPAREIEVLLQLVAAAEDQRIVVQSLHADVIEKAHQLERAVLAKAFRGELVPQDPNDEPAAEMLARLRASHIEEPTRVKVPRKKARG